MKDSKGKQFFGLFFGVLARIVSWASAGIANGDGMIFLFGVGIGFIMSIIGAIISGISIKQARDYGESKKMGVTGLIFSLVGIVSDIGSAVFFFIIAAAASAYLA